MSELSNKIDQSVSENKKMIQISSTLKIKKGKCIF